MEEKIFVAKFGDELFEVHYITSVMKAIIAIESLLSNPCGLFGLDIETEALPEFKYNKQAALSPHLSKIRLLQVFDGRQVYVFDLKLIGTSILDFTALTKFLTTRKFVAHNAVFELAFLSQAGIKKINLGCTLILTKILFHAVYPTDDLSASLESLTQTVLKIPIVKLMGASDWSIEDLTFEQVEYSAIDAVAVLKLAEKLASGITKFGLERTYKLCKNAQYPIVQMQLNGIGFNTDNHLGLIDKWRADLYKSKKEVVQLTGIENFTAHTIASWLESNLDPTTLAIWPRTEGGKLGTDAHTFSDFSWLPIVKPFAAYQKQAKLTSTYGHNLIKQINASTGRIHAKYNLCGARTGRLSSSSPNLQNLPRDNAVRKNFIARPGHVFVRADYSQIELRVAAELSSDETMLNAYRGGIDLHCLTASKVSGKPLEQITKEERQFGKAIGFGLLFGLGSKKFAHYAKQGYGVEVTQDEADLAIDVFRDTYSGYREWQMNQVDECTQSLTVRTPCGKLRRLPHDNTYGTAMNTPIQGGAAEIMLYALIRLQREVDSFQGRLVNCVHDEILIEVPEEETGILEMMSECMTEAYLDVFPDGITRDLVEIGVGKSWGETKEKKVA